MTCSFSSTTEIPLLQGWSPPHVLHWWVYLQEGSLHLPSLIVPVTDLPPAIWIWTAGIAGARGTSSAGGSYHCPAAGSKASHWRSTFCGQLLARWSSRRQMEQWGMDFARPMNASLKSSTSITDQLRFFEQEPYFIPQSLC